MSSVNATREVFDSTASRYDRDRARLIPGYDNFYSSALALVPANAQRIVDLGAGSGILSSLLHNTFPKATIFLVDFSGPMLELARQRLGNSPQFHYILADYTEAVPACECDAIVSSLSIHHLEDPRKQQLFTMLVQALRPGGIFINADHIAGPTLQLEAVYQQRWLDAVRALGATDDQVRDSLFRQQEDRRSPVEAQLAWMREAGFNDVDCTYKYSSFAVMHGTRAHPAPRT